MGKVASDKTDVLKILRDVRGEEALASPGGQWLKRFFKKCREPSTDGADIRALISRMPRGDLLLATLASLTKWEHNAMLCDWWILGTGENYCPLCKYAESCNYCPLTRVGAICNSLDGTDSPWRIACDTGDAAPLIKALRKAVEHVVKEEKERART